MFLLPSYVPSFGFFSLNNATMWLCQPEKSVTF
jgi:hypothetical protein